MIAHPDDHQAVKGYAAKLAKKREKAEKAVGPKPELSRAVGVGLNELLGIALHPKHTN